LVILSSEFSLAKVYNKTVQKRKRRVLLVEEKHKMLINLMVYLLILTINIDIRYTNIMYLDMYVARESLVSPALGTLSFKQTANDR